MSQYEVIKRYCLIIEKVRQSHYPKLQTIMDFLTRKGLKISKRTIQRDFEQLETEFGLRISYSRSQKGYYMKEEDKLKLEPFINFLDILETADILSASLAESSETLKYISFDSTEKNKSVEFIKPVLKALKEHKVLRLEYKSYKNDEVKTEEVLPYLLKQYLGRWYLAACYKNGKSKKLYLFGLDRILSLEATKERFKPDAEIEPKENFKQIIGISNITEPPQKVILSFRSETAPYIKSLPLHSSQRILLETDKECRIEICVKINSELISKILSFGPRVKVLEPTFLTRKVIQLLNETSTLYESHS
jgi:predicted DNA-binding transcriptional regulator YafY